jgi:hypothetical protein
VAQVKRSDFSTCDAPHPRIFSARSKWFPVAIGDMNKTCLYRYDPETKQQ